MHLFQLGDFTLHSGQRSRWKIECEALTADDWEALAVMLVERLPPFAYAVGVPSGGIPLAKAMNRHATHGASKVLICEDVVTTGGSIERFRQSPYGQAPCDPAYTIGCCVFARGKCPEWVTPLFQIAPKG